MEHEECFKAIQARIKYLSDELTYLTDFSTKTISEAQKDIEIHFDYLSRAIQKRKEQLLSYVGQLAQQMQLRIEADKRDLTEKIDIANKLIESGSLMYPLQRDIAIEMWQSIRKITYTRKENQQVQVQLPSLLETIHSHGNVFINAKPAQHNISVGTLAGSTQGNFDGKGDKVKLFWPVGIILNPLDGCLYISDYGNNMIKQVTKSGEVVKFVVCHKPMHIVFCKKKSCFYISEWKNHSIKSISMKGEIKTFVGSVQGYKDGEGGKAMFSYPAGIDVNQVTCDIYVCDYRNHVIRKINAQGKVSTIAGVPKKSGYNDGDSKVALFHHPRGICFDPQHQVLFVCDEINGCLRKVSLDGKVSTVCKIPSPFYAKVHPNGFILVSSNSHRIYKVTYHEGRKTEVELYAGSGKSGGKDGTIQESEFNEPRGIEVDNKANVCFVADRNNNRIRTIKHF